MDHDPRLLLSTDKLGSNCKISHVPPIDSIYLSLYKWINFSLIGSFFFRVNY